MHHARYCRGRIAPRPAPLPASRLAFRAHAPWRDRMQTGRRRSRQCRMIRGRPSAPRKARLPIMPSGNKTRRPDACAVTSQRTRYRHEHPASRRTSRACGNLCNCPRRFAVTVAPCSLRGGNGKAPVRDVWERTPAAWTPRGDLFVNGGGIMHHAEWLGGPVAAAQKCAPMSPCRL